MRMRAAITFAITALSAAPAAAQTRFAWPDTAVDLSKYATLEECRAAVMRVQNQIGTQEFFASTVWRDTVTADDAEYGRPIEPAVAETIHACMGEFADPEAIPLDQYRYIVPLYVIAGWEDRARALAARRLESLADTSEAFAAVVDTLFDIYLGRGGSRTRIRPERIDLVDELVAEYLPRVSDRLKRFTMYWKIAGMRKPDGQVDTLRLKRIGMRVLALADSLDERDRRKLAESATFLSEEDPLGVRMVGLFDLGQREFLDSLRISTAAYNRAKRNAWTRATGQPPETYLLGNPLGEAVPALEGDIWLGCDGACAQRPVPGRVNLIVFLTRSNCGGVPSSDLQLYGNCANNLIPLRRLMERFAELEVTVVARTDGHFAYVKDGITLETEAQLTREWLDSFGVRAPLTMSETPIWRISEYDRRRVERPTANHEAYAFGRSFSITGVAAFLVDHDGIIVHTRQTNRWSEVQFGDMIEVLLERGKPQS